jgi:hypothetical protein
MTTEIRGSSEARMAGMKEKADIKKAILGEDGWRHLGGYPSCIASSLPVK